MGIQSWTWQACFNSLWVSAPGEFDWSLWNLLFSCCWCKCSIDGCMHACICWFCLAYAVWWLICCLFFNSSPASYLIGCDNELAKLHTSHPDACDKVGGVIIMHIDDLRKFALLWLHKTEEVRADRAHFARNITGDIYESGWISEMYGYSFGAAEVFCFYILIMYTCILCILDYLFI